MYVPITVLPPKLMKKDLDYFNNEVDKSEYMIQYDPNDFEDQLSSYQGSLPKPKSLQKECLFEESKSVMVPES